MENGARQNNLSYLYWVLLASKESAYMVNSNVDEHDIKANYLQFRKDDFTSDYLFNHLDASTLNAIAIVINNGILKNECCFKIVYFYWQMKINNNQFNKTIVKKYNFFKNN